VNYPGVALIGCENLAGLYGVNEGIVDGKGTGLQHLFFDEFSDDLIHSATTLIKDGQTIYYGNRSERAGQHPNHHRPENSIADAGYIFTDTFDFPGFVRQDKVFSWGDANIGFETVIRDKSGYTREIEVYAYVITRPGTARHLAGQGDLVFGDLGSCQCALQFKNADLVSLIEEGPTGFIYRTTGAVLHNRNYPKTVEIRPDMHGGILLGRRLSLPANGELRISWTMAFGNSRREIDAVLGKDHAGQASELAAVYWETYLASGHLLSRAYPQLDRCNQVAIKSALIGGFIPADLTGHYFADGLPSYYPRDALMVARAFILSGHYPEAGKTISYLLSRPRKPQGDFYQRYDGVGRPSEGANNNVFQQLDSVGYLLRLVQDYARATGEQLISDDDVFALADVILRAETKFGLVGPEGGVNEGVFGPAFIVSSNMFIYGGLQAAAAMLGDHPRKPEVIEKCVEILAGIEATFIADLGYQYGYVTYHDELVMKYDTPQYFGLLYGFEDTPNMRDTNAYLLVSGSYDCDGIGYSEQEYHHGPWTFNTAACAEYAFLTGDQAIYLQKMNWLDAHCNAYGILPEAFSADDRAVCYINPLVWACGEVVSALHIAAQIR